jgi:hypothetical protein
MTPKRSNPRAGGSRKPPGRRDTKTPKSAAQPGQDTTARRGGWAAAVTILAFSIAFFLMLSPDLARAVFTPTSVVSNAMWVVTVLAVGTAAVTLVTLAVRDMYRHEHSGRVFGSRFIEATLGATGIATLWTLLLAVGAAASTPPRSVLEYIGNATMVGLLLGLCVVDVVWTIQVWRVTAEVIEARDFRTLAIMTIAVAFTTAAFLLIPLGGALAQR